MADHEWVVPYVERVIDFLGLQAWEWSIEHQSALTDHRGARIEDADAICTTNWPYLTATITVDAQIWITRMAQPTTFGKVLICHEVLHIALAQLSHAIETVVNVYIPAEDDTPAGKTTAFTLYSDHEEHTVTRLARQVYEALEREDELQRLRTEVKTLRRQIKQAAARGDIKQLEG